VKVRGLVIDLDGCVYVGNTPIPGAAEAIKKLRQMGLKIVFLTNNSTLTRKNYRKKLERMGVMAGEDEILTSGVVAARYIKKKSMGTRILPIAEEGFTEEAKSLGLEMLGPNRWTEAECVVVGLDRRLTYDKLAKACLAIRAGAFYLATNLDNVYPSEEGYLPGAGSIAALITAATGVHPVSVGKPEKEASIQALELLGATPSEVLFVGDRVDTDVAAAKAVGCKSILVKTGAYQLFKENLLQADYVVESIAYVPHLLETI